jgi:2-hydroxy-3-keto-5-methylthiopentenyl-1-phosphate phosphatase
VRRAVFCDFDGTITADETFVKMLRTFAPRAASQIIPRIHRFDISLRDGVADMLSEIPSADLARAEASADEVAVRPGFGEFLLWCSENSVAFFVVSGGLRGMVERKIAPWRPWIAGVYALDVDASGPSLQVLFHLADDEELVAKVRVMDLHPAEDRISIGDSTTDVRMSEHADLAFARDRLCTQLDERGVPYTRWDTFFDVQHTLAHRWGLDGPA